LTDAEGDGLLAVGLPALSVSAYPFARDDFDSGDRKILRHASDLVERDFITVNLDDRQMGVGGDTSWGAVPHREYTLLPQEMSYRFLLRPFARRDGRPEELARQTLYSDALAGAAAGRSIESGTYDARNRVEHLARGRTIRALHPQTSLYSRGGDAALLDGIRGSIDYRGGDWQGYEGTDFEAIVDLERAVPVTRIKAGFLQHVGARAFLPRRIEVAVSPDGEHFTVIGAEGHDVPTDTPAPLRRSWEVLANERVSARYVRIRAETIARCPAGHPRAGSPAWIFVDEIIVR
jgi:hypothetical protein